MASHLGTRILTLHHQRKHVILERIKYNIRKYYIIIDSEKVYYVTKTIVLHASPVIKNLRAEGEVLMSIRHPYIIECYGYTDRLSSVDVFLPFYTGGDLYHYIDRHGPLAKCDLYNFIVTIGDAVRYLHSMDIAHRDIKPENIFLERPNDLSNLRLADFGFAESTDTDHTTHPGSCLYASPETMLKEPYHGKPADCWSFGVCMYVLCEGELPFYESTDDATRLRTIQMDPYPMIRCKDVSLEYANDVLSLLDKDPLERPTMEDIVSRYEHLLLSHQ